IGDEPAPIAGVVSTLAQITDEIEIEGAAAAEAQGGALGPDARAVGGDEHVGGKLGFVAGHELRQTLRARLLAHLDYEFGVEAEPAAALRLDRIKRGHIDGVLALVVRRATPVEAFAVARQNPGTFALRPEVLEPANHVAMAIAQHRRQVGVLE